MLHARVTLRQCCVVTVAFILTVTLVKTHLQTSCRSDFDLQKEYLAVGGNLQYTASLQNDSQPRLDPLPLSPLSFLIWPCSRQPLHDIATCACRVKVTPL